MHDCVASLDMGWRIKAIDVVILSLSVIKLSDNNSADEYISPSTAESSSADSLMLSPSNESSSTEHPTLPNSVPDIIHKAECFSHGETISETALHILEE